MSFALKTKNLKGYYSVFRIRLINSLQYRAAAIAGFVTQFFWGFMLIMIFEAFYSSGGTQDFSFQNLVTYIWLQEAFIIFFEIWFWDGELSEMIVQGNISYEFVRPYYIYSFWYSKLIGARLAGGILRFLPVVLVAFFLPAPYNLLPPASLAAFLLFILSLTLGLILTTCISMLMYISMFKTLTLMGSLALFAIITDFFGGHYIPIPLMPEWLQRISDFLPFRYASDLPLRIYSGHIAGAEACYGILIEIIWITVLSAIGHFLMQRVTKKVVVFGG